MLKKGLLSYFIGQLPARLHHGPVVVLPVEKKINGHNFDLDERNKCGFHISWPLMTLNV